MNRVSQSNSGDSVIGSAYCCVTIIQNVFLSGRAFNNCLYLGSSWLRLPLLKSQQLRIITKESRFVRSTLHYVVDEHTLGLLHVGLR